MRKVGSCAEASGQKKSNFHGTLCVGKLRPSYKSVPKMGIPQFIEVSPLPPRSSGMFGLGENRELIYGLQ